MCVLAASELEKPKPLNRVEAAIVNAVHRKGIERNRILEVKRIGGRWKAWIVNKGWRELAEI